MIEFIGNAWNWIISNSGLLLAIVSALLALSEALGSMEYFKNSSILAYIIQGLKWIKSKLPGLSK